MENLFEVLVSYLKGYSRTGTGAKKGGATKMSEDTIAGYKIMLDTEQVDMENFFSSLPEH